MSFLTPLQGAQLIQLAGDVPQADIPIYDEFNNSQGRFINYSTYESADQGKILSQSHVDIRSFNQAGISIDREMIWFDEEPVTGLDSFTMSQLESSILVQSGEAWTAGTVGVISSMNHWSGLQLACTTGINTTQSVITNIASGKVVRVNISDGFQDTDVISIALPSFPLSGIDTTNSFIDITSSNDGSFVTGQFDSVPFSASATTLINGNSEFSFPRSTLTNTDLTQITGVRFRITATGNCTVTILAIRLLSSTWQFSSYDLDTLWGLLRAPVTRTGALQSPYQLPTIWRSDVPSSAADPRPVDLEVAIAFNTGQMFGTNGGPLPSDSLDPSNGLDPQFGSPNRINLFFRENTQNQFIQSDLDIVTQSQINGNAQPDFGTDSIVPANMGDLQVYFQQYLDGQSQKDLESQPNTIHGSWIRVSLVFSIFGTSIEVQDEFGNGYVFANQFTLQTNTDYILISSIEDTQCRLRVYPLSPTGVILTNQVVFDSGLINDSFLLERRQGRFGWSASIQDGSIKIYSIRTRFVNFGEYRTSHFNSVTPVTGASIEVQGNYSKELFAGWDPGPNGGSLSLVPPGDPTVPQVLEVTNTGLLPYQGIMSNIFYIENFDSIEIDFDINFPSTSSQSPLQMYLLGENQRIIGLPLTIDQYDQWTHVHLHTLTNGIAQTGPYRLVIVQPTTTVSTTWQVNNVSISERTIDWAARPSGSDAWNNAPAPWTKFYGVINSPNNGVLFNKKDTSLQVRAQLLKQTAYISGLKITPRYAQLGRRVWGDEAIPTLLPAPIFYLSSNGMVVSVDASSSTEIYGRIILYEWDFGDGTRAFGINAQHTYASHANWPITLTITNDTGGISSVTRNVSL